MAGETPDHRRAMAHIKSNVGPLGVTQGYEIASTTPTGTIAMAGYFHWTGECEITSADLMEVEKSDSAQGEARECLQELLASGPRLASECFTEGRQAGISKRTMERAKASLRVRAYRLTVPGPWNWSLPSRVATPPNPSSQELGGVGGLTIPQHTNLPIITNLPKTAKIAKIAPLVNVGGLVGGLVDGKAPPSPPPRTAPNECQDNADWEEDPGSEEAS
jgi:hypothetical protein